MVILTGRACVIPIIILKFEKTITFALNMRTFRNKFLKAELNLYPQI